MTVDAANYCVRPWAPTVVVAKKRKSFESHAMWRAENAMATNVLNGQSWKWLRMFACVCICDDGDNDDDDNNHNGWQSLAHSRLAPPCQW